jgi:hypothetical protein
MNPYAHQHPTQRPSTAKYKVTWEIELIADSSYEAAETASYIQQAGPAPTVFMVNGQQIDLAADARKDLES